jgi:hypothetical protein
MTTIPSPTDLLETTADGDRGPDSGSPKKPRTHVVEAPPVYAGLFSAMRGETFDWENKSGYPKVDISFVGGTPITVSNFSVVEGTTYPATVSGPDGAYLYTAHYRTKDGKNCKRRGPFVMHVDALCRNCIP